MEDLAELGPCLDWMVLEDISSPDDSVKGWVASPRVLEMDRWPANLSGHLEAAQPCLPVGQEVLGDREQGALAGVTAVSVSPAL